MWGRWYFFVFSVSPLASSHAKRLPIYAAPPLCAGITYLVLRFFASADVRNDPVYLLFYLAMGSAWLGAAATALPLVGLSARDDVAERGNPAAGTAIAGAMLGLTLCFVGGNIGNGPGWWVVAFSSGLATGLWAILAATVEQFGRSNETVTVERSTAAGVRAAGLYVAWGVILGRSVAGDWHSAGQTVADFARLGWPCAPMALVAIPANRLLDRSTNPGRPRIALTGLLPGIAYLAAAAWHVATIGRW
ncbi:MAG: hypothetical protein HY897_25710 [Deltaproteobacteria bacterium]|nr:hypothetical protein [Deltaproteobacteria bacterium]